MTGSAGMAYGRAHRSSRRRRHEPSDLRELAVHAFHVLKIALEDLGVTVPQATALMVHESGRVTLMGEEGVRLCSCSVNALLLKGCTCGGQ